MNQGEPGQGKAFADMGEIEHALANGVVTMHTKIKGRVKVWDEKGKSTTKIVETTPGRMMLGSCSRRTPVPFETANQLMTKKTISKMIDTVYRGCGQKETVIFCDRIMDLGFKHACPCRHLVRQGRHGDPGPKTDIVEEHLHAGRGVRTAVQPRPHHPGRKYNKVVDAWAKCGRRSRTR